MKKIMNVLKTVAYEAIATVALWFTFAFVLIVIDGDLEDVFKYDGIVTAILAFLMLASVRFTIYDIFTKITKIFKK